jgi:hypothetical protein
MVHSCVCGGSNENCRFCNGSGILPDRLGAALGVTIQRVALKNTPTDDIKASSKRRSPAVSINPSPVVRWIKCPKGCGRWVNPSEINRHFKKAHAISSGGSEQTVSQSPTIPNTLKPERIYKVCPICKATVKVDRFERHMFKAHKRSLGCATSPQIQAAGPIANRQPPVVLPSRPVSMTARKHGPPCPFCGTKLSLDRIRKHINKAHSRTLSYQQIEEAIEKLKLACRQAPGFTQVQEETLDTVKLQETTKAVALNARSVVPAEPLPTTICPKCKAKVRVDRFDRHIRRGHSGRKRRKKGKKKKSSDWKPLRFVSGGLPGLGKRR